MRFVLVHGGFHGAWCWERTIEELGRIGHDATAVDLPGHGERQGEAEPTTFAGRAQSSLPNSRIAGFLSKVAIPGREGTKLLCSGLHEQPSFRTVATLASSRGDELI